MVAVVERRETKSLTVERGQEIVVRRKNDVGVLFEISTLLSDRDVNILGVSAGVCGEDCLIRLITDDHHKAQEVLAANGFSPEEENVVLVELPHRPGMLKQVTKMLAQEGIDIWHVYAAADREQDQCLLVLHSSNDEVALARLVEIQAGSSEDRQVDQERTANMISEGGPSYEGV
jgi:hypothetical protein